MIEYLTYLVKLKKLYKSITLNFMMSGHTKFTPDGNFGTAKSYIRKHDTQSIISLVGREGMIQNSARNNCEIPYKDPHSGLQNFVYYDWKGFFEQKFLSCAGISKWHTIKIDNDPKKIFVSDKPNGLLREHPILKEMMIFEDSPDVMAPEGCTDARLHDLEFFEDYVVDEHKNYISGVY